MPVSGANPVDQSVTVFTEPAGDTYRRFGRVLFGDLIELPSPLHEKIDTAAFHVTG